MQILLRLENIFLLFFLTSTQNFRKGGATDSGYVLFYGSYQQTPIQSNSLPPFLSHQRAHSSWISLSALKTLKGTSGIFQLEFHFPNPMEAGTVCFHLPQTFQSFERCLGPQKAGVICEVRSLPLAHSSRFQEQLAGLCLAFLGGQFPPGDSDREVLCSKER